MDRNLAETPLSSPVRRMSLNQAFTPKDARLNFYSVLLPYAAPEGAKSTLIQFSLGANFAGKLPQAFVDDVEFVEVP